MNDPSPGFAPTSTGALDGATSPSGTPRTRAITENPALAARTIELLQTLHAFVRLSAQDARCVAGYMRELSYARGERLFQAGEQHHANHLLLVLDGEVTVDTGRHGQHAEVPIAVLGAGAVLGEMSLLDGAPRSATCTAITPIRAAGLARRGLELMIERHPQVAARLLAGLAQGISERLRAMCDQLQIYGQLDLTASAQGLGPTGLRRGVGGDAVPG